MPDGTQSAGEGPPTAPLLLIWPSRVAGSAMRTGAASADTLVSAGQWHIVTRTSTYVVDLERAVVTRFPGTHTTEGAQTSVLRRDHEELPLEGIVAAVGHPATLALRLAGPGIRTLRKTTTVIAIEPAPVVPADATDIIAAEARDERGRARGQLPDDHDEAQGGGDGT